MESPPLYRAPPAPAPRPPLAASSEGHIGSTNNDSDDIYEQLPSEDSDDGGSGEALVRPVPRPRTAPSQQQQTTTTFMKQKMEPSMSDNFVRRGDVEFDKFDNLWAGARRSNRDMTTAATTGSMLPPNSKNSVQQQQQVYLANAFATGRRSHHQQHHLHSSSRSVNNNGTSTQFRSAGHNDHHRNNVVVPGRLNMAEYAAVTDALSRMRLPRTSPPYSNLPNDDYVSDTGHRNRTNRSRRVPGEIYCSYYYKISLGFAVSHNGIAASTAGDLLLL